MADVVEPEQFVESDPRERGALFEALRAPEPELAEQWPFGGVGSTKLGMWTFLASDVLLFGAFIGSYVFTRFEWVDLFFTRGWTFDADIIASTF